MTDLVMLHAHWNIRPYPGKVAASKVPATSLIIYCDVERYASVSEDKISFSMCWH